MNDRIKYTLKDSNKTLDEVYNHAYNLGCEHTKFDALREGKQKGFWAGFLTATLIMIVLIILA
jgi:hypothetical protein